jgi:rubrerythrin
MPDTKEQLAQAIEMALAHELEAEQFYLRASMLDLEVEAKKTFAFLAKEEVRHHQELKDRFSELIVEMGLEEEVDTEVFVAGLLMKVEKKVTKMNLQQVTVREILEMALKEERNAKDLYQLNASVYTQPAIKKTFLKLAKDEEEHIKTLKALIHLLERDIISPERLG